jgi:hypothetical protein
MRLDARAMLGPRFIAKVAVRRNFNLIGGASETV